MMLLLWYLVFGALHEVAHVCAAVWTGTRVPMTFDFWRGVLLQRQTDLPIEEENDTVDFIRHAGWMVSCLLALLLFLLYKNDKNKKCQMAALVTALEAISTDLLGFGHFLPLGTTTATATALLCGNFGIILLHHSWLQDRGEAACQVLEKMVQVTMMRGAQSGGVVAHHPVAGAVRLRVVNGKRTDLSKSIRRRVQRAVFGGGKPYPKDHVVTVLGHTRFATSSKATLEGTHPHQWTPASVRRVYDFNVPHEGPHEYTPVNRKVVHSITHNGDFDYYTVNGKTYDLAVVQQWLEAVTHSPMPASVDSAAVAGLVDVLRTQGCFGLSARYAICLGLPTSKMQEDIPDFPAYSHFEAMGMLFEQVLGEMLKTTDFDAIAVEPRLRESFGLRVVTKLEARREALVQPLARYLTDQEEGESSLLAFCMATIHAFFDNDLFFTTKQFLANAKGSFGLCVSSSLDAHRQVCLAARGQTMSIAFYPSKGLICYGSEQAAVKAGLNSGKDSDDLGRSRGDIDNDALRLDLDDLGGEVILLDWGCRFYKNKPVAPHTIGTEHELMNGRVTAVLFQENHSTTQDPELYHRMTRLSRNRFIKPLREDSKDPILSDIQDIPRVCKAIQDEWHSDCAATSLNRLTAYNLSRCLRKRLDAHLAGTVHSLAVDILLTGCEVSLWLAEQMASDLQKSFPRLRVKALSSNKLLGLYGQEIAVPSLGFPYDPKTYSIRDAIVIIVSHSGGTFGPLSCSNLLQSMSKNIFVVTSEWDTQIGKQLRTMDAMDATAEDHIFNSRIFSTEVGMRPAEPCSVSVAATHQLLTNLFEYICAVILGDPRYRRVTAAAISEQDLLILEKCNQTNIDALGEIVGVDEMGESLALYKNRVETELRRAGDLWAEHVLENAKAYIMTFVYIFATVVSGYPLFYSIGYSAGMDEDSKWFHLIRLLDAALYFWLPQINITILRLIQGRNLLHRMVGRTVVIGDIPWVSQCAEAFLGKIFAVSYSIAGLNVLSGNCADHFVHRHTHRVVRGSLVICGRPDGRLSALSTAEAAVCLSVNQASSIQSLGGTCESITIGHNPFKLALSKKAIFLKRKRPLFLCERMLVETDAKEERIAPDNAPEAAMSCPWFLPRLRRFWKIYRSADTLDFSSSRHDSSVKPRVQKKRSAAALIGAYMNFEEDHHDTKPSMEETVDEEHVSVDEAVANAIKERKFSDKAKKLFEALDVDGNGFLSEDDFVKGSNNVKPGMSEEQARTMFNLADYDASGHLDYDQFLLLLHTSDLEHGIKLPPANRDERGIIQVQASQEKYFGSTLRKLNSGKSEKDNVDFMLARSQHFSQELYETRIASMQRFVAMTVLFHQMGHRVQSFFGRISFGLLAYRMDRTHSICRIATTASPVSGADVKQRMRQLRLQKKIQHSIHVISMAYLEYKAKKQTERITEMERRLSSLDSEHGQASRHGDGEERK